MEVEKKESVKKRNSIRNPYDPKNIKYTNAPAKRSFLCFKSKVRWSDYPDRRILSNVPDIAVDNNEISTSKYNILTFLPKNLMEQFAKLANLYFLVIGILQIIPAITNSQGQPLIYLPLFVIIFISMMKDLFEDLKRHRSDNEENFRKTLIYKNGSFVEVLWKDVRIGNIIKLKQNEYFPADLLIIMSSDPKGSCFIETKNLDGETNLKHKLAKKEFLKVFTNEADLSKHFWFIFEKPNPYLYNFNGAVELFKDADKIPIDNQNFVLRGCSLRNTKWVVGLVGYSGHESKIMLNSVRSRSKQSKVERIMNRQIFLVFLIQMGFCAFSSLYYVIWYNSNQLNLDYLFITSDDFESSSALNFVIGMGSWLLLFTNFVPISLLVTLEMVKFIQALIISKDKNLRSLDTNTFTTVQSSNLNEELGQVEYIFSDKTGTLTCNIMEFKYFCAYGHSYGDRRNLLNIKDFPKVMNVDFQDKTLFDVLEKENSKKHGLENALLALSLCHTTITEENENKELQYNASSPDELALVNFCKFCGYEFRGLDQNNMMIIKIKGQNEQKFQLLHVLEFNSNRKRMSVIVKAPNGDIELICKGADSILMERINKNDPTIPETWKNLEKYASIGLRTLVLAKRIISNGEYNDWSKKYQAACTSISDREAQMTELQSSIETKMELIGATAIEDKLQDEVGLTIQTLKRAGIKIWVLTGDKIETAINIGYSTKLLSDRLERILIDGKEEETVSENIEDGLKMLESAPKNACDFAMVLSGDALIYGMMQQYSKKIMAIAKRCKAVIACRVSPKQKEEIVSLVRRELPNITTLAIGDGANDVNMITAAHVGIGIKGVEGQQAARASDYSIGEFKILRRLLLYVGRESYRKNSHLILYNFYKNMVFVLPHFWYAFLNGFSGSLLYDPWLYQFFNLFYASLPIIIYAVFDEEFPSSETLNVVSSPPNILENSPHLYSQGMKSEIFNRRSFWYWFLNGAWQGAFVVFLAYYSLELNLSGASTLDYISSGMMSFTTLVIVTNIKIFLFSNTSYPFSIFIIIGSIAFYLLNYYVGSKLMFLECYGTFVKLMGSPNFYLGCVLTVIFTNFIDLGISRLLTFVKRTEEVELLKAEKMTFSGENIFYNDSNVGDGKSPKKGSNDSAKPNNIRLSQQFLMETSSMARIEEAPTYMNFYNMPNFDTLIDKNGFRLIQGEYRINSYSKNPNSGRKYTGFAFSQDEPVNRDKNNHRI